MTGRGDVGGAARGCHHHYDDLRGVTDGSDTPIVEPDDPVADVQQSWHRVADGHDGPPGGSELCQLRQASALEGLVADCQDLVDILVPGGLAQHRRAPQDQDSCSASG